MARNWLGAFRPASFRGVPFEVDRDGPYRGRRVAVHEISGGEAAVTEDMGRRQPIFRVDAYVAGDAADGVGLALEAACGAYGPSLLVLPMDPPLMVHCTSCRRNRERDRAGYVAYDLDFVEAGSGMTAAGGISALKVIYDAGAAAVASALAA